MSVQVQPSLASLYEEDETAWLEQMAELVAQRRCDELDYGHLSEFLTDMARSHRREVVSRLITLMAHLLKWERQPEKRSNSWSGTIDEQQTELSLLLESSTLRVHAAEVLEAAYSRAVKRAAKETGFAQSAFPTGPSWSLEQLLEMELPPE